MDNIQTLLEKGQYELVIKLTENPHSNADIFSRMTAFLALGKAEESLETIKKYRKQLETDLPLLMKGHIQLLCLMQRFDEAYEEEEYYQSLPYHSQEAEEILKSLKNMIRQEERKTYNKKNISDEELKSRLLDKDETVVLFALERLKEKDINPFIDELKIIMKSFPKQTIRTFALFQLIEKHIDMDVEFLHVNDILILNPIKLTPPFMGKEFTDYVALIENEFKDVSLSNNAINILSSFLIYIYPDHVPLDENLLVALRHIASQYLQIDLDLQKICKSKKLDYSLVKHLVEYISLALNDF